MPADGRSLCGYPWCCGRPRPMDLESKTRVCGASKGYLQDIVGGHSIEQLFLRFVSYVVSGGDDSSLFPLFLCSKGLNVFLFGA